MLEIRALRLCSLPRPGHPGHTQDGLSPALPPSRHPRAGVEAHNKWNKPCPARDWRTAGRLSVTHWMRNRQGMSLDSATRCLMEGIQVLRKWPERLTSMTYFPSLTSASFECEPV